MFYRVLDVVWPGRNMESLNSGELGDHHWASAKARHLAMHGYNAVPFLLETPLRS